MEVKFIELNEETALENVNMGIRVDNEKYNLGDSLPDSYNWLETEVLPKEEWENARLDGTCAVSMASTFWYDEDRKSTRLNSSHSSVSRMPSSA